MPLKRQSVSKSVINLLLDEILKGKAQSVFAENPPTHHPALTDRTWLSLQLSILFFRKKWKRLHQTTAFKLLPQFVILNT